MKNTFVLLACLSIIISSCQKKEPHYEEAIKKLIGKTWIQVRKCYNDSCYNITTKKFYTYFPKHSKNIGNNIDSICLQWDNYDIRKDGSIKLNDDDVFHSWIIFCSDSLNKDNIYPTVLTFGHFRQVGNLSFISDSEFVLFRHFPKFEIPERTQDINDRDYFKIVNTPKDISDLDK